MGAGGDDDAIGAVLQHLVGAHSADAEMHLDVLLELGELRLPVGDHAAPFVQARQGRDRTSNGRRARSRLRAGAPCSRARPEPARTPCRRGRRRRRERCRACVVLVNFSGCQPRRYSSPMVTFCVHMIWPPCWNFETQMLQPMHSRMSSSRPSEILVGRKGSAIEGRAAPMMSSTPARIRADHVVGAGEAPVADHRNAGAQNGFALLDEGRHPAGLAEARHAGILAPFGVIADLERHRIDDAFAAKQLQQPHAVLVRLDAFGTVQRVHLEARGDAAAVPQRALQRMQQFDEKSRAVGEAAAVVIRAPVEARLQELDGQRIVAGRDLEQIEARRLQRACRPRRTC